jgi:hypothetical protein
MGRFIHLPRLHQGRLFHNSLRPGLSVCIRTFSRPWTQTQSQRQSQSDFTTGGLLSISSSWRQAPWASRPEIFLQMNACGHSPYVTTSLTRRRACLLWICLAFSTIYTSSVSTGFTKQIMPILRILCYNDSLVTWTVVSFTKAKFMPPISSMSAVALSHIGNMFILMILYDSRFWPAQFGYIIIYIRKVESCVQITDWCAPWKISNGAENLVLWEL